MSVILGWKAVPYPLDPPVVHGLSDLLTKPPYPAFPPGHDALLNRLLTPQTYIWTLNAALPLGFSVVYYILAHTANGLVKSNGNRDYTKGSSILAKSLRFTILVHNAILTLYSGWTFAMMLPIVLHFFHQGFRIAGLDGVKLAMCSMPTNVNNVLGPYAYLFYLSKYYEVLDSVVLLLKGKRVSNLQSYHHAGAIICMWIAYRYSSQPVWVFCLFNSFVHTCMYSYYFCSAMRWPFPRAVKRNLTTLQIAQIASGTFITNLYLITSLRPELIIKATGTRSRLPVDWDLRHYALQRAQSTEPSVCLQSTGAELALHVNTCYMLPLLALFANFFVRAYLKSSSSSNGTASRSEKNINGLQKPNGNHPTSKA